MKTPLGLCLASIAILSLAPTAPAQIDLDIAGGLIGENATFNLAGSVPSGEFVLLTFSNTKGPLFIGSLIPGEPGFLDQDLSLFDYPSFFQVAPITNPLGVLDLSTLGSNFVGFHVFSQAWTVPGPTSLLDLKSNVVTLLLGGHGFTTPTLSPPLAPHSYFSTVPLASGNILATGGGSGIGGAGTGSAEIYDYRTAEFAPTANAPSARASGVAVRLNDGRVLIAGGIDGTTAVTKTCEIYDPATNTFSPASDMGTPRALHAGARLYDGRVLVCGGSTAVSGTDSVSQLLSLVSNATATAEIYDPVNNTWSFTTAMPDGSRTGHVAALLPDGRVLAAGGVRPVFIPFIGTVPTFLATARRYNPATTLWDTTASMTSAARALSSVARLNDGRIMVAGGLDANLLSQSASARTEVSIFDNAAGANGGWQEGPNLATARYAHSLTTLPSGHVVAAGGVTGTASVTLSPTTISSVERYTPPGGPWIGLTSLSEARAAHGAVLTPDGKRIVVIGGANDFGTITPGTAELYVP
jgi:Kelch motif protein